MHPDDGPLAYAFRPRRADVILRQDVEQRGADQAGEHRGKAVAHDHGRPHELGQVAPGIAEDRYVVDGRQPVGVAQQREQQQHADPEGRQRKSAHGDQPHGVVDPGAALQRRHGAQRNGKQHREQRRQDGDLEGDREAGDDLVDHGPVRPHRPAEVEGEEPDHPLPELHQQRLVQPQADALGLDRLRRHRAAVGKHLHLHDVAGDHPQKEERDDRHADQRRDHQQ